MKKYDILSILEKEFPPIVYRTNKKFKELTGISPRHIANLDCQGKGPSGRVSCGRMVGYPRECLIKWLSQRMQVVEKEAGHAETNL